MSKLTPDLLKGVDIDLYKVVIDNEKVVLDGNEYSVNHLYISGLYRSEIVFDKNKVRGVVLFSDKPGVTIGEDIIIVNKGLSIGNVKAVEEVINGNGSSLELMSKPATIRVVCESEKCCLYINDNRSYLCEKIHINVRNEKAVSVINVLLNPIKIMWIYLEEARIKVKASSDQVFVELINQ